ncbi:MAG TPA: AAA family ATPase [Candidatus Limnocylindria bacterium]|nr:AAA family ATPase [Candidatus Limnocylindria bacterium]
MADSFIGRRVELDALKGLIARGRRDGAPGVALVTGDPGSGKSRLVREAVAGVDGRRVVLVSGFEPTQAIPFAALGELVRRLGSVPEHGARLERLVFGAPELTGHGLLQAFESAHRAITAFGPLVVVVDDLQWLDTASLGLANYLVSAAEAGGNVLVVIAAARPSPAAVEFAETVLGRVAAERATSLHLGGLPFDDAVALARAIAPGLDRIAAADLSRRAGGSPFWLETLVRARGAGMGTGLIGDRLRSLSADAATLVSALAVAARPLDASDAASVLAWPAERVAQALRELESRGLATSHVGAMRLMHDLIREAVATDMPGALRTRLHGAIARTIEASAADDLQLLAEALEHRLAAGLPAVDVAMRVAASPRRRLIGGAALERLGAVADTLDARDPDRLALQAALARLAGDVGLHETAMRHWDEVAAATDDHVERQHAQIEAARAAYMLGMADQARSHLERARELPADRTTLVTLDAIEADIALWLDHDTAAGAASAERALAGARALISEAGGTHALEDDARLAVLHAFDVAADAALQQDRGDDVLVLGEVAASIAAGLTEETRVSAGLRAGFELRALGFPERAVARYRDAWESARRLMLPTIIVEAGRGLARALRDLGRLEEARAVAEETLDLESRLGQVAPRWGTAGAILHSIELSLGDLGALDRLREDAATTRDPHYELGVHQLVATQTARREGARAGAEVERALSAARAASSAARCPRCARELSVVSAELLARIGRPEDARRELRAWEDGAVGATYVMRDLWRARARAAIAAAEGHEATTELLGLAAAFERMGLLEDAIWARLDLAGALARSDRRSQAVEEYGRALELADQIKGVDLGRRATRGLRELGVRAWRRSSTGATTAGVDALSRREREVSRLVAAGASNREIADALMLSKKTVERHITNILAKMGARNRTELASFMHAHPDAPPD